jgi:hypothetical protein
MWVKNEEESMTNYLQKFNHLIVEAKKSQGQTPLEGLRSFVHFLKEMKKILLGCSQEEREKVFMEFQNHQKDFEESLKGFQLTPEQMKDPVLMDKLKHQLDSDEFKTLIKEMSETLFEVVKIMAEGKI